MKTCSMAALREELGKSNEHFRRGFMEVTTGLNNSDWNWKPDAKRWSIAQVVDHLLRTNGHYIITMENVLEQGVAAGTSDEALFRAGRIADFFVRRLYPGEQKPLKPMKAPGFLVPSSEQLDGPALGIELQNQLSRIDEILERSIGIDLGQIRIPFPVGRIFTLKMGDALRIVTAHNNRHLIQMRRVREEINPE